MRPRGRNKKSGREHARTLRRSSTVSFFREFLLMPAQVNTETCTGCGDCVEICPLDAIELQDEKAVVDEDTCSDCGACVDECPTESITVE
jgi:ferredoxin